jgi:hypothetical protein
VPGSSVGQLPHEWSPKSAEALSESVRARHEVGLRDELNIQVHASVATKQ